MIESEYQRSRELSARRMVDFVSCLQNYHKQLLREIELHEKQFNDVHNLGAVLIKQGHPAGEVIEVYLRTMQNQWDWILNLNKCLEGHLRDACNAKAFVEESEQVEQQMQKQLASFPSVVFGIPPPDPRLASFLSRLHNQFEKLRKLWDRTHHLVRYNMVLNTMRTVRAWDLDTFLCILSDQRDEIIKTLNEDVNKLLSEMDPNDPLAKRLKDELRMTNEHFYDLLARAQKEPEPDYSNQFDAACAELLCKFEEGGNQLNHRVQKRMATNLEELERQIKEHKAFEDALKHSLDVDVSNVKELYRQLFHPMPTQRTAYENMVQRWQDIWELLRMYVERLKGLESVLNGLNEVTEIVRRHEINLASIDDMPAALKSLSGGTHAQLQELSMVLQQKENIMKKLNRDTATLRFGAAKSLDVDQIEDRVSQITVRSDNVNSQVAERLSIAEEAQQTQKVYRSQYTEEKKPRSFSISCCSSFFFVLFFLFSFCKTNAIGNANLQEFGCAKIGVSLYNGFFTYIGDNKIFVNPAFMQDKARLDLMLLENHLRMSFNTSDKKTFENCIHLPPDCETTEVKMSDHSSDDSSGAEGGDIQVTTFMADVVCSLPTVPIEGEQKMSYYTVLLYFGNNNNDCRHWVSTIENGRLLVNTTITDKSMIEECFEGNKNLMKIDF